MPDVRLVDLEVIKRFSLAVRREAAPAHDVLAALDASRRFVLASIGAAGDGEQAEPATPAATTAAGPARRTATRTPARTTAKAAARTPAKKASKAAAKTPTKATARQERGRPAASTRAAATRGRSSR